MGAKFSKAKRKRQKDHQNEQQRRRRHIMGPMDDTTRFIEATAQEMAECDESMIAGSSTSQPSTTPALHRQVTSDWCQPRSAVEVRWFKEVTKEPTELSMSNITLISSEGRRFYVHSDVMCPLSPYLDNVFRAYVTKTKSNIYSTSDHCEVVLHEITSRALYELLRCCYLRQPPETVMSNPETVQLTHTYDNLVNLRTATDTVPVGMSEMLQAAHTLEVIQLKQLCEFRMLEVLKLTTEVHVAIDILIDADRYELRRLRRLALQLISQCWPKVHGTPAARKLIAYDYEHNRSLIDDMLSEMTAKCKLVKLVSARTADGVLARARMVPAPVAQSTIEPPPRSEARTSTSAQPQTRTLNALTTAPVTEYASIVKL